MNRTLTTLAVLSLAAVLAGPAAADGLRVNGLGARAQAMGGAYVGLSDDLSAFFWNPAGLAMIRGRCISASGLDLAPRGSYQLDIPDAAAGTTGLVDARTAVSHSLAGLIGFVMPIGRNLAAGLAVYTPAKLGIVWKGGDFAALTMGKSYEWSSAVGLMTIAPALAWQVSDRIAVGASFNIQRSTFGLKTHAGSLPGADGGFDLGQYEESLKGWGCGASLGVLVRPHRILSLGASLRTASEVTLKGDAAVPLLKYAGYNDASEVSRNMTWPLWLAFGIAVFPDEDWTLTADIQYSDWSVMDVLRNTYADASWAPLIGEKAERPLRWTDATRLRLGAEYRPRPGLALRAGYYRDPSPAPDATLNVLLPSFDVNALTLGFGYALDGLTVDIGFEIMAGAKRTVGVDDWQNDPAYASSMPGTYTMTMLVPTASVGYRF
ncbi:MAG: outer membrane protein transport protein [Candidatus Aminicenantes bacterium]|nr:outer membrane protein transport protein [Candidatus Aminicenantes bacterium]